MGVSWSKGEAAVEPKQLCVLDALGLETKV